MKKKPTLLAIGPQNAYPPIDGGKEGIFGALLALEKYFETTYIFPNDPATEDLSGYTTNNIAPIPVDVRVTEDLLTILFATIRAKPFKFFKYSKPEIIKEFERVLSKLPSPEVIICFHAHTWELGKTIRENLYPNAKIIVREHNIEFEIVASYIKNMALWKKILALPFLWLTKHAEISMWNKADCVAFLSDADFNLAKRKSRNGLHILAREGIPIPELHNPVYPGKDAPLLILFNAKAPQSVFNLRYFIDKFWKEIYDKESLKSTVIHITGVDNSQLEGLLNLSGDSISKLRIKGIGFQKNLKATFEASLALLSPTFSGGGIRKKILEAMANELPVIASTLDINSTSYFDPDRNILEFTESPDSLIAAIQKLKIDANRWTDLRTNGRLTIEEFASWDLFARTIFDNRHSVISISLSHK